MDFNVPSTTHGHPKMNIHLKTCASSKTQVTKQHQQQQKEQIWQTSVAIAPTLRINHAGYLDFFKKLYSWNIAHSPYLQGLFRQILLQQKAYIESKHSGTDWHLISQEQSGHCSAGQFYGTTEPSLVLDSLQVWYSGWRLWLTFQPLTAYIFFSAEEEWWTSATHSIFSWYLGICPW